MRSEMLKAKGLGILVLCSVAIAVGCLFYLGVIEVKPVHDPDAPMPIYSARMTVDIVNTVEGVRYPAYGVGVLYQGEVFIVTSRLLLHNGVGDITVNGKPASLLGEDLDSQLIAITAEGEIPVNGLKEVGITNLLTIVTNTPRATTLSGTLKSWTIVTDVPPRSTGAAVFSDDDLVGVVIGGSNKNPDEAFMAGNGLLIQFANKVIGR